jgi:membrane protein implicated in regulation of membrane protease activity
MPHISPTLAWFLLGIAFFVIELALPGFIIFFFGIGAWCTALAVFLLDLSLSAQLGVFLATSLVTLFLLRKYIQQVFIGVSQEDDPAVKAQPVSDTGVVTEDIVPPARGRVKFGGSFWKAEAETVITSGTAVKIVAQNNLVVKVLPLSGKEEEK